MRARSFTLVEMVIVVVIIGILIVTAFPKVSILRILKFQAAGKKMLSDIRYTQSFAALNHVYTGIWFLPANDAYWVYSCANTNANTNCFPASGWPSLQDPLSRVNMGVNYVNDSQYKGIAITSANFGTSSMLVFDPSGVPVDSFNGVPLSANGTLLLNYSGESVNANVVPKSGKVYVHTSF